RRAEGKGEDGPACVPRAVRGRTDLRPRCGPRERLGRQGRLGGRPGPRPEDWRPAGARPGPAAALRGGQRMNLPAAILPIGWLVRDTLRQSLASRLFWAMLAVSAVCIVFCLSVRTKDAPRLATAPGETGYAVPKDDPQVKRLGTESAKAYGIDILEGD